MSDLRHRFVNPLPDQPGFIGAKPSHWNDNHGTSETDTSFVLRPDGHGGVVFGPGGFPLTVTDGTTSVANVTQETIVGAVVSSGGAGEAIVTVPPGVDFLQDTDPGAVGAGKIWLDTTAITGTDNRPLYVRNPTDTGWFSIGLAAYDGSGNLRSFVTVANNGGVSAEAWDATGIVQSGFVIQAGSILLYAVDGVNPQINLHLDSANQTWNMNATNGFLLNSEQIVPADIPTADEKAALDAAPTALSALNPVASVADSGATPYLGTTPDAPIPLAPVDYLLSSTVETIPAYTYYNGPSDDGVGATVTENAATDGVLTADDASPTVGQRIVFCLEGGSAYIGVYVVTVAGDGSTVPWVLTRATDCDTWAKRGRFWAVGILSGDRFLEGTARVRSFEEGALNLSMDGIGAFASGDSATAAGLESIAIGEASKAVGDYSSAFGNHPIASSVGEFAHSSSFTSGIWAQFSRVTAAKGTSDDTPTALVPAFAFLSASRNPDFTRTSSVRGRIVGRRTDTPGTDSAWDFSGVIRGDGASAYSWVGGADPVPAVIAQDTDASTWAVAVTIGGVEGRSIVVTVTGEVGKTIAWMTTIELDEVV